jgi:hypothetical protein
MSDGIIFAIGGVLFLITTGATIAFLLSRFMELHRRELLKSPAIERIESDDFTEIYVAASEDAFSDGIDQPAGSGAQLR